MRSAVTISVRSGGLHAWLHDHLDAVVSLLFEGLISIGRIFETESVSDYKRRINLAKLNQLQQRLNVLVHVCLAHLKGETFLKGDPKRELVEKCTVNSGH